MKIFFLLSIFLSPVLLLSQSDRWQQFAEYEMEIDMDVKSYLFEGKQKIKYTNNSPDELDMVFYHLYYNAFQPGSMMDVRSLTILDPDSRVQDRISKLDESNIGYQKILSLKRDGTPLSYHIEGTILEVELDRPIRSGETTTFEMEFEAQVPEQIRRTGRNNKEGISLSMSQWYPKMCEYDYQGWHANPYVGREFYGVWANFDVKIKIDRSYTVAATGLLNNPHKMGHGYSEKDTKKKKLFQKRKLNWEFKAENVHDFVWAADPDYTHKIHKTNAGVDFHYFYQENEITKENWELLPAAMNASLDYINKRYGVYPYPTYAFIQGGDGGMEYPMATLITGERSYTRLVSVCIHELMHSWYQMILGTNESLYPWMDEGFTNHAQAEVINHLKSIQLFPGEYKENPHLESVNGFARWAKSGNDEALITHDDHYTLNRAHSVGAYTKGSVFLTQLEYIIGKENFDEGMLKYFDEWKFKHPNSNDFIRVMEKQSGLELDWYKEYWIHTTHTIDYKVEVPQETTGGSYIHLKRVGYMPMPIDLTITLKDGTENRYNIPLRIMRGEKSGDTFVGKVLQDWPWTHPDYSFRVNFPIDEIEKIEIDEGNRMADIDRDNNQWVLE